MRSGEPASTSNNTITVALAGDTMLGRSVADRLRVAAPESLVHADVVAATRRADMFVLNLECCVSDRGTQWPRPDKPFHFRAPPEAVRTLTHLGVDCVTLANNHALDYGEEALLDTFEHLTAAGIEWVGAGPNVDRARQPVVLESSGFRLAVLGVTDHPNDFAADLESPGVAYADLWDEVPSWLVEAVTEAGESADAVLVAPHWGPNMTPEPVPHVRRAARTLVEAGATLVAGHSAHVFHGIDGNVLFDLGDFLDDYAVDPELRNDLGLLFLVTLDRAGPLRVEAIPLRLEFCFTRMAQGEEAEWIGRRFRQACADLGTEVIEENGRLVAGLR
jgi:poly-gamma-glutamate capsule biosynthesis protein CapA/YwtB (metallophosphatase superfamily)